MSSSGKVLNIERLSVTFGAVTALRDVSIAADRGEIVFIVGPNGAGKSTLLLAISQVVKPKAGKIHVDGVDVGNLAIESVCRLGVAHVPEGRRVFTTLTVAENIRLATLSLGSTERRREIDRVYSLFPILAEKAHQPASKLSGGQQQMLALARAFAQRAKLILIDEPSLGLAPKVIDEVYKSVVEFRRERGVTLLIVEQSVNRAVSVADRVYVLRSGQVTASGQPELLTDSDALHEAYFGDRLGARNMGV